MAIAKADGVKAPKGSLKLPGGEGHGEGGFVHIQYQPFA